MSRKATTNKSRNQSKSKSAKSTRASRSKNARNKSRNGYKVPEALPTEQYKEPKLDKLRQVVFRKKPEIKEIVREPTAGGIVFRMTPDQKDIEILLIQDSKNRWTIPKGHIEPGETAKQTAVREIGEESGLKHVDVLTWLGKIHFKYRRMEKLVLMTTQVYLVQSLDKNEHPTKEKWMNGIRWFSFSEALDAIEYADIEKLMLIAKKRIRSVEFN
jgi:ADP-ribose pyrophosphatase YjhB (NUDIX family)